MSEYEFQTIFGCVETLLSLHQGMSVIILGQNLYHSKSRKEVTGSLWSTDLSQLQNLRSFHPSLVPRLLSSLFGMTSHIVSSKIVRQFEWERADRE